MVTKRCPPREGKQSETRTNDLRDRLVSRRGGGGGGEEDEGEAGRRGTRNTGVV